MSAHVRLYTRRVLIMFVMFSFLLMAKGAWGAYNVMANHTETKNSVSTESEGVRFLKERGLIQGDGQQLRLQDPLTYAEAATLLVRAYAPNEWEDVWAIKIFFSADSTDPLASWRNWYHFVQPTAWYAPYVQRLDTLGFRFSRDMRPNDPVPWETYQKAQYYLLKNLFASKALQSTASIAPKDLEHQITTEITTLFENELSATHAYPAGSTLTITRNDAFERTGLILKRLWDLFQAPTPTPGEDENMQTSFQVKEETAEQNSWLKDVKRVIIARDMPNPGYALAVSRIEFDHPSKQAIVYVRIIAPDPNQMYPQVITRRETEAFVPAAYSVDVKALASMDPFQTSRPTHPPAAPFPLPGEIER